jgi:hypothetical protein
MTTAVHADAPNLRASRRTPVARSVTELYAEISGCKSLWASSTEPGLDDEYLAAGKRAQDQLIEAPAKSLASVGCNPLWDCTTFRSMCALVGRGWCALCRRHSPAKTGKKRLTSTTDFP